MVETRHGQAVMTTFIWILAWLPLVLPAMSTLPRPINVNLTSKHFIHELEWEPGPGTPTEVHYSVTVSTTTSETWEPVAGCQHVRYPLVCDLTEAFSNREESYFTQVKAVLGEQESQPGYPKLNRAFNPEKDTFLDLPLLTVISCGKDLCVDLQPPIERLRKYYDSLQYNLRIKRNNADRDQFIDIRSLRTVVLDNLASGSEYCVSVCFSDSDVPRESNYSQPVCALTPSHYTADPWISVVLCLLVMCGVILLAMLVATGFICLRRRPLPSVLTSIHHIEGEVLLVPSCSLSSLLNVKPTAPSSGDKRSSQTSDESDEDEESVTEITGVSSGEGGGGGYEAGAGGSTSLSSSSASAPLSSRSNFSSNQTSDCLNPETEPWILTETHSTDGLKEAPTTHSGRLQNSEEDEEEEEEVREEDSQDVDLLTLTFGTHGEEEEEEEEEKSHSGVVNVYITSPTLPSQTKDTKEVAIETLSSSEDEEEEEEEEEHSGYMGR